MWVASFQRASTLSVGFPHLFLDQYPEFSYCSVLFVTSRIRTWINMKYGTVNTNVWTPGHARTRKSDLKKLRALVHYWMWKTTLIMSLRNLFSFQFLSKTCIQITGLDNLMFESKYTRKKQSFKKWKIRNVWQYTRRHYEGCRTIKAESCTKRQLSNVQYAHLYVFYFPTHIVLCLERYNNIVNENSLQGRF